MRALIIDYAVTIRSRQGRVDTRSMITVVMTDALGREWLTYPLECHLPNQGHCTPDCGNFNKTGRCANGAVFVCCDMEIPRTIPQARDWTKRPLVSRRILGKLVAKLGKGHY